MEMSGQLHALAALPQGKSPGSRAVLDAVVERKIPNRRRESTSARLRELFELSVLIY
jgi:hypothetical protein